MLSEFIGGIDIRINLTVPTMVLLSNVVLVIWRCSMRTIIDKIIQSLNNEEVSSVKLHYIQDLGPTATSDHDEYRSTVVLEAVGSMIVMYDKDNKVIGRVANRGRYYDHDSIPTLLSTSIGTCRIYRISELYEKVVYEGDDEL